MVISCSVTPILNEFYVAIAIFPLSTDIANFWFFQRCGFRKMEMAHPALKDWTGDFKLKYVSSSDQRLHVAV